jgi:hypothetical protein
LGGLRATRQDLLAWDVPEHGSVWKPFMPAKVAPRWRDIPAWAMAAAASLMFVVGAAGGVLTHALMEKNGAQPDQVAAATPSAVAQPIGARVPQAELTAMEQRMLSDMRAELASLQRQNARTTLPPTQLVGMRPQEVSDRIDASERQQFDSFFAMNNFLSGMKKSTDARIDALAQKVDALSNIMNSLLTQQQAGR